MIVRGNAKLGPARRVALSPRLPTGGAIDGRRQSPRTSARLRGRWTAPAGRIAAPGYWRPVLSNGLRGASAHGLGPEARRGRQRPPPLDRLEVLPRHGISRAAGRPRDTARRRPPGDRSCRTASRRRVTASATKRCFGVPETHERFATVAIVASTRGRDRRRSPNCGLRTTDGC